MHNSSPLFPYLSQLTLPDPNSHKGQNGKLLIIGGSELFHAASRWSLDVASKFVDMVFYSSVPSNNELIKEAKGAFWNGIVIPRNHIDEYIAEASCILIGPGMTRDQDTAAITNRLLANYGDKKWVIDAGALQMVEPTLLRPSHIVTPHYQELVRLTDTIANTLIGNAHEDAIGFADFTPTHEQQNEHQLTANLEVVKRISGAVGGATMVIKGVIDIVGNGNVAVAVSGGNAGMTKGGTGDVLAGLVAALYCTHDSLVAAVAASYINKQAGNALYTRVGPYFNASDLVAEIPEVAWQIQQQSDEGR